MSTLTVWGHRDDRDIPLPLLAELLAPSFIPTEDEPTPFTSRSRAMPLQLGEERQYMLLLHSPSVRDAYLLAELLEGRLPAEWLGGGADAG